MMATTSVHSSHQMLSSSLLSSGWEGSSGPMVPSDKFGDQQVLRPELLRKQRKERTVYSSEQRRLLQEHFDQFMYPSLEQRVELALLIGVTEYEIRIWFKNQRARFKQKNSKNVKEVPESTGSSKNVSVSIHSQGHLSVLASANVESMSPDTSTASSISKLNPSLEASFCNDQAVEDAGCSSQEDLLDGQGPATSPNPGKPTVIETQTDPEVTDGPVSVEAPVPTTAAARSPYCAQYLHPPSEHLWKWIGEDQDTREDS
ncbi:hypothetical protein STEG23_029559 [Scotinomys teguina]